MDFYFRNLSYLVGELFPDLAMENTPMFDLRNRRYVGCKTKLKEWIFCRILKETHGAHSFLDMFGGTGVISQMALGIFEAIYWLAKKKRQPIICIGMGDVFVLPGFAAFLGGGFFLMTLGCALLLSLGFVLYQKYYHRQEVS